MLATHGLPQGLPMFITEHNPYHLKAGMRQYNLINAACLVKSLYFTSVQSPGVKILPWVVFHEGKIQTRFMWFAGPNEPDSRSRRAAHAADRLFDAIPPHAQGLGDYGRQ